MIVRLLQCVYIKLKPASAASNQPVISELDSTRTLLVDIHKAQHVRSGTAGHVIALHLVKESKPLNPALLDESVFPVGQFPFDGNQHTLGRQAIKQCISIYVEDGRKLVGDHFGVPDVARGSVK